MGTTFIGASLVALATSLPEMVTSLAAVRLGAYDLAVGNLFGSNAFNMMLVLPLDLAYTKGSLLQAVSATQVTAGLLAIILMSIGIMGVIFRKEKRWYLLEPDSLILALAYFVGLFLLFRMGLAI
jgi:cation:H+ antiporter